MCLCVDSPCPGEYTLPDGFDVSRRMTLPKSHFYTFGYSASRDQQTKLFNPFDNLTSKDQTR